MYSDKADNHQVPKTPTTTSTNIIMHLENELLDISEDELIEILKPKFDKREPTSYSPHDEPYALTIETTQAEMNEFNLNEQQQQQLSNTQTTTSTISKSEKQKQKNEKLKWKQRNRPDFQNKLTRPIYYKYDFRKIRTQLRDDNIHTSHQITINRKYHEVIIGFKFRQELEHVTNIIKINYFSKAQYSDRWNTHIMCNNQNSLITLISKNEFLSTKLTSQVNRQLQDPVVIMMGHIPSWIAEMAYSCLLLIPSET
ncbi:unnamed protein product [Rotaria sp. Silwood1]|nr:unnamed protein product [Rotaria sp. Silwood1]CAF1639455.1 unnamed protein product [Rotaria sp. Silwood1]